MGKHEKGPGGGKHAAPKDPKPGKGKPQPRSFPSKGDSKGGKSGKGK